jgi:hypothetical protein
VRSKSVTWSLSAGVTGGFRDAAGRRIGAAISPAPPEAAAETTLAAAFPIFARGLHM